MKRWLLMATLITAPLQAQTAVTLWLSSQQNNGGDSFTASQPDATTEFENGSGYGASISRVFGARVSGELAIFRTSSEGRLRANNATLAGLGDVELTPIMAMARYHFRPDAPLDVYVGAGAAYVMTEDLDSADLRADDLAPLGLDEETAVVFGGGLTWNFAERLGATLDARVMPLSLRARANGQSAEAGIDPLLLSAGLRIRF